VDEIILKEGTFYGLHFFHEVKCYPDGMANWK